MLGHAWPGDAVVEHNLIRDCVADYAARGRMHPVIEAPEVLKDTSLPDGRRRPADILVCSAARLVPELPDGSRSTRHRKVALDFAVVNALGQNHWQETLDGAGRAAASYAQKKRRHQDTDAKCRAAGILFQPIVLESQGGIDKEASGVLHRIAEAVAEAESRDAVRVREEMLQRIALIIARSNHSRLARRRGRRAGAASQTVLRAMAATALVKVDDEGNGAGVFADAS